MLVTEKNAALAPQLEGEVLLLLANSLSIRRTYAGAEGWAYRSLELAIFVLAAVTTAGSSLHLLFLFRRQGCRCRRRAGVGPPPAVLPRCPGLGGREICRAGD